MSYRIIIQKIEKGDYKHLKQYTLDDLEGVEIIETVKGFIKWCERKSREEYEKQQKKQLEEFLNSDLFDSKAVGHDISREEFLQNEIWEYTHR